MTNSDAVADCKSATAQRVFVRAANDSKSTCSKRRPRFSREEIAGSCVDVRQKRKKEVYVRAGACPAQLSSQRQTSSIPIADEATLPPHQQDCAQNWIYPSERQFYDAMQRKGWQPETEDMSTVVQIHNAVNERVWREITHWETSLHADCHSPKLKSFRGRPREFSPKARLLNFLGYKLPFDRHDWIVDRCGRNIRYVIDFYNAAPQPHMPIAMHLDVRPALDTPTAFIDRLKMQWRWIGSGRWRRYEM